MLPKNKRIPRKMFPLLNKGVKVFKNKLFLLRFVNHGGSGGSSRFCFSVSKKVAKKAVTRNKMRRMGYQSLEKYMPGIRPDMLAVFSFISPIEDKKEIGERLESILKESNLLR